MSVNFDKKTLVIIAISLVIGMAFGSLIVRSGRYHDYNYGKRGYSHMMKMGDNDDRLSGMGGGMMGGMMNMTMNLEGKTGDEFDKAFLNEMIVHHEGAVDMAELAKKNANHQEIKDLADQIIAAQNKEIADMKAWSESWFGK